MEITNYWIINVIGAIVLGTCFQHQQAFIKYGKSAYLENLNVFS